MSKTRVLIHAFTVRRDVAASLILKALLERNGCEVLISSRRNLEMFLRYWRPHVVVMNVYLQSAKTAEYIKGLSPLSRIVSWPGEGGEPLKMSHELLLFKQDPSQFKFFDKFLLWGIQQYRYSQRLFGWDPKRFRICGNPRLDLVKFLPGDIQKKSIGVLGRFEAINRHTGAPLIRALGKCSHAQYKWTLLQAQQFLKAQELAAMLLKLNPGSFISWRPHPLESIQGYEKVVSSAQFDGRIEIDQSLSIAEWFAQQSFVLTPSSSTFLEAYLLRIPTVNIDSLIAGSLSFQDQLNQNTTVGAEFSILLNPDDDIATLLEARLADFTPRKNEAVEKNLRRYHNWDCNKSAIATAALEILDTVGNHRKTLRSPRSRHRGLPKSFVELIDKSLYMKLDDPFHKNYSYCPWIHQKPKYHDAIVSSILALHPEL
jgi:surface carbohydrate biosynthesis protein